MRPFKFITLAFTAIILSGVFNIDAAAQSRRKTVTKTTKNTTRKTTAPAGALATFKYDDSKSEICLMPKGKVTSSNSKLVGRWERGRDSRAGEAVYMVSLHYKNADGNILVFIVEDEAYILGEQGSECDTYIVPGSYVNGCVLINSCEEEEVIDLSTIPSTPVKWLKN